MLFECPVILDGFPDLKFSEISVGHFVRLFDCRLLGNEELKSLGISDGDEDGSTKGDVDG